MKQDGASIAGMIGQLRSENSGTPTVDLSQKQGTEFGNNSEKILSVLNNIYNILKENLKSTRFNEERRELQEKEKPTDFQREAVESGQQANVELVNSIKSLIDEFKRFLQTEYTGKGGKAEPEEDNSSIVDKIKGLVGGGAGTLAKAGGVLLGSGIGAAIFGKRGAGGNEGSHDNQSLNQEQFEQLRKPKVKQEEGTAQPVGKGGNASTPTQLQGNSKQDQAMNYFMGQGWSKEQAAGIVGNLMTESGNFNEKVVSGQKKGDSGKAVGIAQWHPERQQDFKKLYGKDLEGASFEEQLAFVNHELTQGKEKKAGDKIRKQTTAEGAAAVTDELYERSSGEARKQRQQNAAQLAGKDYNTQVASSETATKEQPKDKQVDDSALKVKGGLNGQATAGGEANPALMGLAKTLQAKEDLPGGINQFTAFDDEYHHKANPKSKHTEGLAMDFSLKDPSKSSEAQQYIKDYLTKSGLSEKDFKIIDEYKNPSGHATGGHLHVNFANKEAAEKYASLTGGGEQPTQVASAEKVTPEQQSLISGGEMPKNIQQPEQVASAEKVTPEEQSLISGGAMPENIQPTQVASAENVPQQNQEPMQVASAEKVTPENQQPMQVASAETVAPEQPIQNQQPTPSSTPSTTESLQNMLGTGVQALQVGQMTAMNAKTGGLSGAGAALGGLGTLLGGSLGGGLQNIASAAGQIQNVSGTFNQGSGMNGISGGLSAAQTALGGLGGFGSLAQNIPQGIGGGIGGGNGVTAMNGMQGLLGMGGSLLSGVGSLFGGGNQPQQSSVPPLAMSMAPQDKNVPEKSLFTETPKVGGDLATMQTQSQQTGQTQKTQAPAPKGGTQGRNASSGGGMSGPGGSGYKDADKRAGSSSGAMGLQIGVRNEEPCLMKAQYGCVRIV